MNAFTVQLAYELKDTKIKVNAAHPGWVKTDLGGDGAPMEIEDGAKTSVVLAFCPRGTTLLLLPIVHACMKRVKEARNALLIGKIHQDRGYTTTIGVEGVGGSGLISNWLE